VKAWLSEKGIAFTEHDVSQDEDALAELENLGFMATPVIVIDGEAVVGFNQARLNELLGCSLVARYRHCHSYHVGTTFRTNGSFARSHTVRQPASVMARGASERHIPRVSTRHRRAE